MTEKKTAGGLFISQQSQLRRKISHFKTLIVCIVQLLCLKLTDEHIRVHKTPPRGHLTAPRRSGALKVLNPSDAALHLCSLQRMILIPNGDRRSGEAAPLRLSESHLSPTRSARSTTESRLGGDKRRWEGGGGGVVVVARVMFQHSRRVKEKQLAPKRIARTWQKFPVPTKKVCRIKRNSNRVYNMWLDSTQI